MPLSRHIAFGMLLALVPPGAAAGQARIEARFPDEASIRVELLGTVTPVPAQAGMMLVPGDIITTADSGYVELRCPATTDNTYRLIGPFRVLLDAPRERRCHINLLAGDLNVLAEEPTEQTVGAVTLLSSGTQYAVVARRADATAPPARVIVFDGTVEARASLESAPARAGTTVAWDGSRFERAENTPAQLRRWSGLYARFDATTALRQGTVTPVLAGEVYARLDSLHYAVLEQPDDVARRVELARTLIAFGVFDQARYNLTRAGIVSDTALRRYDIDPALIRRSRE